MRKAIVWSLGALVSSASMQVVAGEPAAAAVDWAHAQPVAALAVRPMAPDEAPLALKDREGLYVLDGTIVDLRTGHTLMSPRLIVHRGDEATIERDATDGVVMKLTVRVDATTDRASTTTELRDNGVVTSTSTTRFSFARS